MTDGLKHTDAAEMEAFLVKPSSAQLLEIWLNTRETNGSVADVQREQRVMGLEIQKARLAHSEHVNGHMTAATVAHVDTMWTWFDRLRFLVILLMALQPFEIAIIGWWLLHR